MVELSASIINHSNLKLPEDMVVRIACSQNRPYPLRRKEAFILRREDIAPEGYAVYISFNPKYLHKPTTFPVVVLPESMNYLGEGDIIRINGNLKRVRCLFRLGANSNAFLLTERCNHYCLMCSQPPKNIDDSWIVEEAEKVIKLVDKGTSEVGFTGGEPTLLGSDLIKLINMAGSYLPDTSLHILTNGRKFIDIDYVKQIFEVRHKDLMLGIPVYSEVAEIHDYVVQSKGAFDETIRGIYNLYRFDIPVEIRVVLHKITVPRLVKLAEFIARNMPFVSQVALMGMETTGFARANIESLWIEPDEYSKELEEATHLLSSKGIKILIYNLQRCLTPPSIWKFMVKSISDWKNELNSECINCVAQPDCAGFFTSATHKLPRNISAYRDLQEYTKIATGLRFTRKVHGELK